MNMHVDEDEARRGDEQVEETRTTSLKRRGRVRSRFGSFRVVFHLV